MILLKKEFLKKTGIEIRLKEQEKNIFQKTPILQPEPISKTSKNPFDSQKIKKDDKKQINPYYWAENPNGCPWIEDII